jgi:hypothetical protein
MSTLPFRFVSNAMRVPSRDQDGSVSMPRENVICRWSLASGRITKMSPSLPPALYAIRVPSGDHEAPISQSWASVRASGTIPVPSGFTSTSRPRSSLKTIRPFLPPKPTVADGEPAATIAATIPRNATMPASPFMRPPWTRAPRFCRREACAADVWRP